ncbi:MAG: glycine betaine/L-proline ABC transporter substrate-binding protein ProX [Neisseria sp.]|uniref:glycine betaine/L-proline ABC transporter substrate-binding protein ProX n=1 Tax=Neisseria sp. TaxID=192066 RepID=UPI0026DD793C|nr:glycine betaine/L-proline ABC transporter substrate-binding protein ProX [Neisseria sp.]MDO4641993.1 glycine betaine/L-proline ABC transporter substrate-binding protein ProX [Neisseria sp.]
MNKPLNLTLATLMALGLAACGQQQQQQQNAGSAASAGATTGASDNQSQPGKGVSVQALQSSLSEETFQTLVVNSLLKELGYEVKPPKEVDYSAAYTAVASGDATFLAVNWDPLHNEMYKNAGGDNKFYRQGNYITGAAQGYLIDKKTADQYKITNIEQFKDPKIAKLFDTDGDGKADLTGCQAGWGCEAAIEYQLDAYKLRDHITHKQGQYAAIISDTITRYKEGKPVFYYTWTPYWVSGKLVPGKDVVWLQVPFSANPEKQDTTAPDGKNYGFAINNERIVANKAFAEANPAAAKLFAVAQVPVADVNAENTLISDGENKPDQIQQHADNWIKANRATVDKWLAEARAAVK